MYASQFISQAPNSFARAFSTAGSLSGMLLPGFSYTAVMDNGIMEHELCPVYRVIVSADAVPNAEEVGAIRWVPWKEFADEVLSGEMPISPWAREQVPLLVALGPDPLTWPAADRANLPPAAR